jgi:hypothetical protein
LLIFLRSELRLLVTANVVPSSQILLALMTEAILSSETSLIIRVTWNHIPEDYILHCHRGDVKSYKNMEYYANFLRMKYKFG